MEIVEVDGTGARKQASKQDSRLAKQTDTLCSDSEVSHAGRGEGYLSSPPPLSLSLCTSRVSIFEMNGGERMGKWDGKFRAFLQNGRG